VVDVKQNLTGRHLHLQKRWHEIFLTSIFFNHARYAHIHGHNSHFFEATKNYYVHQASTMLRKKKPAASNNTEKTLVNDTGKLSPIRVHHAFQTKSSAFPDRFTNAP
jgi:hypothetical protein